MEWLIRQAAQQGYVHIVNDLLSITGDYPILIGQSVGGMTISSFVSIKDVVLHEAAKGGHVDMVISMLDEYQSDFDYIGQGAAEGGHETLMFLTKRDALHLSKFASSGELASAYGSKDYDGMAVQAAKAGYSHIVMRMIDRGARRMDDIVEQAARHGRMHIIVQLMDKFGYDDYDLIAYNAARNGYRYIVELMIRQGATEPEE